MFNIRLVSTVENRPGDEPGERFGSIPINNVTERFGCCDAAVPVDDFASEWRKQLLSLVAGRKVIALVHDPRFAWIVYREGDQCYVQQRLALDGCFDRIPPRQTVGDDGGPISEWSITIKDIKNL
jgi:hypothetical protein